MSPWTDIAHRTFLQRTAGHLWPSRGRNNAWTHQPTAFRELSLRCSDVKSTRQQFSNWTHQDANRFCRLSPESHVSFHSLPRRFVVVTLHSADVTNPSVVPQEPSISFATFGIQRRASLSLNPLQIIAAFSPLFVYSIAIFLLLDSVPLIDFAEYILYTEAPIVENWTPGTFWMNYCF